CRRLLAGHTLECVESIDEATSLLKDASFDLIVCTMLFDESRMLDLLRLVKREKQTQSIPFVCVRIVETKLDDPRLLKSLQASCSALGAAGFFDFHQYKFDPELQLVNDIESCLPNGSRQR